MCPRMQKVEDGQSEEEYRRAVETWKCTNDMESADEVFKDLSSSLGSRGVSREERIQMLQCFERHRSVQGAVTSEQCAAVLHYNTA